MWHGRTFNILVRYFNSHQMENSMFQLRFQCGPPMAGQHGSDRPSKLFTSLLPSFATSSHVSVVCGPELSFRTASFLACRFKWKMPNFCQVLRNLEMFYYSTVAKHRSLGSSAPQKVPVVHGTHFVLFLLVNYNSTSLLRGTSTVYLIF